MTLRLLGGIGEIAPPYDGFILDLWGVLHDGTAPFPGVLDALARLKSAGKRVAILSNAPRRAALVAERLRAIGIPPRARRPGDICGSATTPSMPRWAASATTSVPRATTTCSRGSV